jgi:two-component system sensor histidine kinase QseC
VWWAVRRSTRPLRQLGWALAARRPQSLEPVAADDSPSEMLPMLQALNRLLARVAALLDSERRFTADAAHELRTPIAAVRSQAQVALGEADETRRRHALQATVEGCDRASRLVDQLLTLARLDSSQPTPHFGTVDLAAVARQVAADLAPRAIAKCQTLEVDAATRCRMRGDATLMAVLVRNLADNAVRYAPHGATVRIGVHDGADGAILAVEDSGPGLSDADMARLGERFFRVTGSAESGSGLGWSIVRRVAEALGLELKVGRSVALGGLRVQVAARIGVDMPREPAEVLAATAAAARPTGA